MQPKWSSRDRGGEKYIYLPTKGTTYFNLTGKIWCAFCKNNWTWYNIVYNTAVKMTEQIDSLTQKRHTSVALAMELCFFKLSHWNVTHGAHKRQVSCGVLLMSIWGGSTVSYWGQIAIWPMMAYWLLHICVTRPIWLNEIRECISNRIK